MRSIRAAAWAVIGLALTVPAAWADDEGLGPYVRGGVTLGWANVDDDFVGASVSNGVNAGFNIAGGYRFMPALAGEIEFFYITGGDVEVNGATVPFAETNAYAFTANIKAYPLMFAADDATGLLQPYLVVGIGGGSGEVTNVGVFSGSEGTFLARFGGGLDLMLTNNLGVFADGSYYVTTKDVIGGIGTISFGGIVKF
jgi:opacity protein-like surface antigen